jgi:alcohol dehydrogenase
MWLSLEKLRITQDQIAVIADNSLVLPDYKNNPRIATRDEVYEMLLDSYQC